MADTRKESVQRNIKDGSATFLRGRHALMGFILLLIRDPHQAEDVFQEVWVALVDAMGKGTVIDDQAKWCRGVARNLAREFWRQQRDVRLVPDTRLLEQIELAFDEHDLQSQYWTLRREVLAQCVDKLPDHSRQMLSLRYDTGLSMSELASRLQRTIAAVTKTLSRTRAVLEACIERHLRMELDQ